MANTESPAAWVVGQLRDLLAMVDALRGLKNDLDQTFVRWRERLLSMLAQGVKDGVVRDDIYQTIRFKSFHEGRYRDDGHQRNAADAAQYRRDLDDVAIKVETEAQRIEAVMRRPRPTGPAKEFELKRAKCNSCGTTDHRVIVKRRHEVEVAEDVDRITVFSLLECCGCQATHLVRARRVSEWNDEDPWDIDRYPPALARHQPDWLGEVVSEVVGSLFEEVYIAIHTNAPRLAVIGARAILDLFLTEHVGNAGTYRERLDALEVKGVVVGGQRVRFQAALDAGHAAAHRGHTPSEGDVSTVLDIVEEVFHQDVMKRRAEALRQATPPRPKKA